MDMTWVTERVALGGGIWNARNMEELAQSGVTHVLNMQIEFDDRPLAEVHGVQVLWNPTDDDFLPKSPELLKRGVDFPLEALERFVCEQSAFWRQPAFDFSREACFNGVSGRCDVR